MNFFQNLFFSWPSWKLTLYSNSLEIKILLRSWNYNENNRNFGVFSEIKHNFKDSIYEWFAYFSEGIWNLIDNNQNLQLLTNFSLIQSEFGYEGVRYCQQNKIIQPIIHEENGKTLLTIENFNFILEKEMKIPFHPLLSSYYEMNTQLQYPTKEQLDLQTWTFCKYCDLYHHSIKNHKILYSCL